MAIARGLMFRSLLAASFLAITIAPVYSQNQPTQPQAPQPSPAQHEAASPAAATIRGLVKSGNMPIPGAAVIISVASSTDTISTWTDVDGSYSAAIPTSGKYTVRVQMTAFANSSQEVVVDATHQDVRANFELTLLTRTHNAPPQPPRSIGQTSTRRGFQSLAGLPNPSGQDATAPSNDVVPAGMPVPGLDPNGATESIAVSGNTTNSFNQMSGDELQQRINDARQQGGGFGAGGFGGPGGFGGGGGRGGGPMTIVGRRGFDINHPHGSIYYGTANSALNAAPFALTGEPAVNPAYAQNNFGGSIGGPLNIPKIYHGGTKTFFFVNYNGKRGESPFDQFSTVPTLLERQGNFSQTINTSGASAGKPVQIVDPATGIPFPNNTLPQINPVAQGLLQYIPKPNLPGSYQNFIFITSENSSSDDLNARINHTFGAIIPGGRRSRGAPRNSLSLGFHYHGANNNLTNPFPSVGGSTSVRSFDVPIGYIRSIGKLTNSLRFDFNRSRTNTHNLHAFTDNITGNLGITGVSSNPFDWGLPNLSFTNFASLQDINPQLIRNQTYTFSDYVVWTHGKHSWRWGGDYRRVQLNTETSSNSRGSFIFSGVNTGYDFADFLYEGSVNGQLAYGLPQQTSVQFGNENYHFHGNYWDLYLQDEWKLRGNLTLNLGVRYEYVSPLTEENNRIANLDLSPGVLNPALGTPTAVVIVPGQIGPYGGPLPNSLMHPDRNNFAPRVGVAWKPFAKTIVRAGYGINYNTGAYQGIAQQLAFQPPFSTAATNIESTVGNLTLANGFPLATVGGITNNYAVNPDYRLGYVQIRNLDIQQQIRPTLLLNIDYTGTKGTDLDILEAPNRTATAIRMPNVQAFNFENSVADSEANAGSVRLRKRLASGFSVGGIYTFSKSIDNASSIGGGATSGSGSIGLGGGGTGPAGGSQGGGGGSTPTIGSSNVAQNAFNLSAERGLSSFNQTQRLTVDYLWELPFGRDRHWLSGGGPMPAVFGDWQWSGDFTLATGLPFTPRFLGDFADVNRGSNGTLRPNLVPGESVPVANPSIAQWFNTAAFVAPPTGQFGDARRNSIIGPGMKVFDMALSKMISLKGSRMLELRAQATNVFNMPNYSTIDTVVNSPTFGRVTAVGAMRQLTMTARFRF